MSRIVFDLETDGLLDDVTTVWCGCTHNLDTGHSHKFGPDGIEDLLTTLKRADEIIGHNIISYDLMVIRKLYGIPLSVWSKVTDTLVMSRTLNPDRKRPYQLKGKTGTHSLEAWGHRLGLHKGEYDDWSQYTDEMMEYCMNDVQLNALVYQNLMQEMER